MAQATDVRFSDDDRLAITRGARTALELAGGESDQGVLKVMVGRVARNAIGCGYYDLTDAENAWVDAEVERVMVEPATYKWEVWMRGSLEPLLVTTDHAAALAELELGWSTRYICKWIIS